MTKKSVDPGDWSSAAEALFRSSRGDHAPSARDRERVRQGLAHKLLESSDVPAASPDARVALRLKGGAAVGNLIKLGAGIAIVMAGVFMFMWAGESSKQADPRSEAAQASADRARAAEHALAPSTSATQAELPSRDEPPAAVPPREEGPARPRPGRRARERDLNPQTSAAPSVAPRSAPTVKPTAAAPASPEPTRSANVSPRPPVSASEIVPASESTVTRPSAPEPAETQSRPGVVAAASSAREPSTSGSDEAGDARVELAFVRRIHAAMLETKPDVVLALCAEHERRWPSGMFVQEREGLRAMAWCQSGVSEAAARARTFFVRYPRGPLAPRVREACASQLKAAHEPKREAR